MHYIIIGGFLIAALINLLPVFGIMGVPQLEKAYGVSLPGPDLAILMRHRALLFGIVGGLLAAAAFMPSLRVAAFSAGMLSMVSFVILQALEGGSNAALTRLAYVDYVGIAALAIAGAAAFVQSS
ncbi:MAG: phosphopantetheine adenylyltransferase [Rhodobiaceae bacterium]|nr:MAG: phosphopantetheine adenylyltransferase [Rhodobiaceae bacterium]